MVAKLVGNREDGDRLFVELSRSDIEIIASLLLENGARDLGQAFKGMLAPDAIPELLYQGDLISGSKEEKNHRWIAVVLHEQEIRDACESTGTDFCTLDLDNVVKLYTDALLGDGVWYESLKAIVADEGEEEDTDTDVGAGADTDADTDEYTAGNPPCPNCCSDREAEYVPVCDRNPRGLASQTPEEHSNMQEDGGIVLCEDDYCNPREITMEEFRAIHDIKDADPQDVITRCHECGTIKG